LKLSQSAQSSLDKIQDALNAGLIQIQDAVHEQASNRAKAAWQLRKQDIASPAEQLGDAALARIRGLIVGFLLSNYGQSGLKQGTGKLKQALRSVQLKYRKGRVCILMPSDAQPYRKTSKSGKVNESSAYTVWFSQEYGAVRTPNVVRPIVDTITKQVRYAKTGIIGSKARRSIRNLALKGKPLSDKSISAIESAAYNKIPFHVGVVLPRRDQTGTDKSVKLSGGATVIKPKPFWRLSPSQWMRIAAAFAKETGAGKEAMVKGVQNA